MGALSRSKLLPFMSWVYEAAKDARVAFQAIMTPITTKATARHTAHTTLGTALSGNLS